MKKRKIEIFSAGCPDCYEAIDLVKSILCQSCEVTIKDMSDPVTAKQAKKLGVKSVPAIVIDGELAACCKSGKINVEDLKRDGIGKPL
jgi:glutaredoxin